MTDKFDEVACALKNSEALPWSTNGKHCNGSFKLLLAGFRRMDRARASASRTEEDFGEKDQLLADILSNVNDNEERGRLEREESAKRDERFINAGQEVRANAMRRRAREESAVVSDDGDEEGDNAVRVTASQNNSETPTSTEMQRARKRQRHSAFDLEDMLATSQERREEQQRLQLQLETDRLHLEKKRAESRDRNEEKQLDILSAQADLQRQQQSDSALIQLKMLQVMDEMMKRLDK
jgi:hypothetical protein